MPPRRPGAAWGSAGRAREDAPAGAAPAGGLGGGARLRRQGLLHRPHEPHHQLDRPARQVGPRAAPTPPGLAWGYQPGLGRGSKGTLRASCAFFSLPPPSPPPPPAVWSAAPARVGCWEEGTASGLTIAPTDSPMEDLGPSRHLPRVLTLSSSPAPRPF